MYMYTFDRIEAKFQRKYNEWFKQIQQRTWQYPSEGILNNYKPCLRFKTDNGILPNLQNLTGDTEGQNTLTPVHIGFIARYKYLPFERKNDNDEKLEISHICGNARNGKNSLCIEGSHLLLETKEQNQKRRKCHNYIRQFVNECKRYHDVITVGTIRVFDVNKRLTQKGFKYLKKYGERRHCKCKIRKCFINFGKV